MKNRKKNNHKVNNEIRRYYHSLLLEGNEEEFISDFSPKTFNFWKILTKNRKKFGIGRRLIDIGGGVGDFASVANKNGYEVTIIDFLVENVQRMIDKYPELKGRVHLLDIFDEKGVSNFIDDVDQFDVVAVLGSVPNHAENKEQMMTGLYNITKFGGPNSIFAIDLLFEEMFIGKPSIIWSDFKHTLASFFDIGSFIKKHGLQIIDLYTIHEFYPSPHSLKDFEEHSIRLFLFKPW